MNYSTLGIKTSSWWRVPSGTSGPYICKWSLSGATLGEQTCSRDQSKSKPNDPMKMQKSLSVPCWYEGSWDQTLEPGLVRYLLESIWWPGYPSTLARLSPKKGTWSNHEVSPLARWKVGVGYNGSQEAGMWWNLIGLDPWNWVWLWCLVIFP